MLAYPNAESIQKFVHDRGGGIAYLKEGQGKGPDFVCWHRQEVFTVAKDSLMPLFIAVSGN